jgi:hypothetical protein
MMSSNTSNSHPQSSRSTTSVNRGKSRSTRMSLGSCAVILVVAVLCVLQFQFQFQGIARVTVQNSGADSGPVLPVVAKHETVHVVYGLSGDDPGFMGEFEISLKSVLLNSPIHSNLTVHIMADEKAAFALPFIFNRSQISTWHTRNHVAVQVHNVQSKIPSWESRIVLMTKIPMHVMGAVHTVGAFFRLFVQDIVPSSVNHALYMDTDIVLMAPLDGLWKHVDRNSTFQWGESQCSGFLVLNVPKLDHIWHLVSNMDLHNASKELKQQKNDQLIFQAINRSHPEIVSMLPKEWDVERAKLWRGQLADHRPDGVGFLHFNGGGKSKDNAFLGGLITADKHRSGWGLANYYVRMPWPYAKFIVESSNGDSVGHQLLIRNIEGPTSVLEANNTP